MTFADMPEDPVPKRRKQSKARKAGKAGEEECGAEAAAVLRSEAGGSGAAAGLEEADSEPAELTRTGAAEVAADADVSIGPQGMSLLPGTDAFPPQIPPPPPPRGITFVHSHRCLMASVPCPQQE